MFCMASVRSFLIDCVARCYKGVWCVHLNEHIIKGTGIYFWITKYCQQTGLKMVWSGSNFNMYTWNCTITSIIKLGCRKSAHGRFIIAQFNVCFHTRRFEIEIYYLYDWNRYYINNGWSLYLMIDYWIGKRVRKQISIA